MGSRGPAPSPHSTRGRKTFRRVTADRAPQPDLPNIAGFTWPEVTRRWWARWGRSPLARDFTAGDWDELLIAARCHAAAWAGDVRAATELRNRVAKFGATPADRARLRVQNVVADEAEHRSTARHAADATARQAALRKTLGPLMDG